MEAGEKEYSQWEYYYQLKNEGEQLIRIPPDAVAYAGIESGRFRFYRREEIIGNNVHWLPCPGYYRWMRIISKQGIGDPERKIELI